MGVVELIGTLANLECRPLKLTLGARGFSCAVSGVGHVSIAEIISGPGSFAVQFEDYLRSRIICGPGIICGPVQDYFSPCN